MASDTQAHPQPFTGQAGALLQNLLDAGRKDEIRDRKTLVEMIHDRDFKIVVFELDADDGDMVDLYLFEDGSAFCASRDDQYCPWPIEWISNDIIDEAEFTPRFPDAGKAIDFDVRSGDIISRVDAVDIPGAENWFEAIASEMLDPPQALRDAIVAPVQDVYWEDREGQEHAQSLIYDFVGHYLNLPCNVTIHTNNDGGRPPVQKRYEQSMCKQLNEMDHGFGTHFEREALYSGQAYAEINDAEGIDYTALVPINGALAWFSQRLLAKYGQPVGWETDYNDGAYNRMSGYSANAESVYLDMEPQSNHHRVEAVPRLRSFLESEGLYEEFKQVCAELKLDCLHSSGSVKETA